VSFRCRLCAKDVWGPSGIFTVSVFVMFCLSGNVNVSLVGVSIMRVFFKVEQVDVTLSKHSGNHGYIIGMLIL